MVSNSQHEELVNRLRSFAADDLAASRTTTATDARSRRASRRSARASLGRVALVAAVLLGGGVGAVVAASRTDKASTVETSRRRSPEVSRTGGGSVPSDEPRIEAHVVGSDTLVVTFTSPRDRAVVFWPYVDAYTADGIAGRFAVLSGLPDKFTPGPPGAHNDDAFPIPAGESKAIPLPLPEELRTASFELKGLVYSLNGELIAELQADVIR